MRNLAILLLCGSFLVGNVGCFLPAYSGDPAERAEQMLNTSEDFRQFHEEWERFWMLDHPSHMTPYRTHGGII